MAKAQRACPSLVVDAVLPEKFVGTGGRPLGLRVRQDEPRNRIDQTCAALVWV